VFTGKYFDWNQKKVKGIVDHYSHNFMVNKKILDLGCGYADISGPLHRLGAAVTALDAREDHLKVAAKRYPGIKTVKHDLDRGFPFQNETFDLVLHLGLLCHLSDYESHLIQVCKSAKNLVLETAVCDHSDENKVVIIKENKAIFDLSVNGNSSRPTAAAIERVLTKCGMKFTRVNSSKYNSGSYKYDWIESNTGECDFNKRRIWFCVKDESALSEINHPVVTPQFNSSVAALTSTNLHITQAPDFRSEVSQQLQQASMSNLFTDKSSENKLKFILNLFTPKFFFRKHLLDAGAGNGDLGASFSRLGAAVIAADARQENLNVINKKYPNIKTVKLNFESPIHISTKFDIVLSIDTLCHVANYESHLKDLCSKTKDMLILETAVCDSNDPNISYSLPEDTKNNSLSFSGMGSRPTAAKIEKIFSDLNISYTRLDHPDLNNDHFLYDWKVLNSKNQNISLRRFWIVSKRDHIIKEINRKFQKSIPVLEEEPKKETNTLNVSPPVLTTKTTSFTKTSWVKDVSKSNSILEPERFSTSNTWDINFSVAPTTFSSRQWIRKIQPYFSQLKVYSGIKNLKSFAQSGEIDLSIGSLNNFLPAKNLFLEEYEEKLSESMIVGLGKCCHIITPSFNLYNQLTEKFPDKKITRLPKLWFNLNISPANKPEDYAIYFEKNEEFTPSVVKNFNQLNLKNLIVVGSRLKLPTNIIRISEYEDYNKLISLIYGAKAIIDISNESNYESGLLNLAIAHDINVITNNIFYLKDDTNLIFIRNKLKDNKIEIEEEAMIFAFSKFKENTKLNYKYNSSYNQDLYNKLLLILGK
jgi:2-polyprenyl-3-methyl-5-hydroxy-6-metoxy-1,4-benzoquinol methylase